MALEGVDTVLHCRSDPRRPDGEDRCTTNLIPAITDSRQDVHVVYISIVGVDAIPWSYYRAKHDAEKAVASAHVSWTLVAELWFADGDTLSTAQTSAEMAAVRADSATYDVARRVMFARTVEDA